MRAGVPVPPTVGGGLGGDAALSQELRPPYLLKPVEGQHFAGSFGQKVIVAADADHLVAAWREAKKRRLRHGGAGARAKRAQQHLLALRLHRPQRQPARDGDRDQGAAGPDPLRDERRLPHAAGAACPRARTAAPRERRLPRVRADGVRLRRARRRVQAARGEHSPTRVGRHRDEPLLRIARIAYDDSAARRSPRGAISRTTSRGASWRRTSTSRSRSRAGGAAARAFLSPYLRRRKVRAVLAADDPLPALGVLGYLGSKL